MGAEAEAGMKVVGEPNGDDADRETSRKGYDFLVKNKLYSAAPRVLVIYPGGPQNILESPLRHQQAENSNSLSSPQNL